MIYYFFEFKCRRCSEKFTGEKEEATVQGDHYLGFKKKFSSTNESHSCEDGGYGVADFIGVTPLKQDS